MKETLLDLWENPATFRVVLRVLLVAVGGYVARTHPELSDISWALLAAASAIPAGQTNVPTEDVVARVTAELKAQGKIP